MKTMTTASLAVLAACLAGPTLAGEISLETAPPVVVKTVPVAGATDVDPALTELRVTFSKPMQDESWSWVIWDKESFPEKTGGPHYLSDGRTCALPVKLERGKFYALWLNSDEFKDFEDRDGHSAVPYLLTFTTASNTVGTLTPLPNAEDLPGKLLFHGRYRHRSRGRDIAMPSELWVKESPDGTLNALAELPFSESAELATGNRKNALTAYRIGRKPSGSQPGYDILLQLSNGTARLTRHGVRQDVNGKILRVPEGAWFDPNTRPDSYCAANILLRAFNLNEGEEKEFRVYDWDNSGEAMADYVIQVRHAGKERVEVPAGAFKANHLILTQKSTADTWFKKRAGHVTDFWVLDNHAIVRVLRHREPYEMVLLDYTTPEKLDTLPERKSVRVVLDDTRMTFEGKPATWNSLASLFSAVPERDWTALEWAVPSTQITIEQQNNWSGRFATLAQQYGFEYSSYVGVHPLGSRGGMLPSARMKSAAPVSETDLALLLNDDQKAVIAWTDRQFRSYWDERNFGSWSAEEIKNLEAKSLDALNGPRSRGYYQAIDTLGALRSTNALPRLRELAFERVDKNNRDRWMAVRVLGVIGDRHSIPDLIHLLYHGNPNTHWWAQVSLIRLTGQNFGGDWEAWGKWWNESGGRPAYHPEIIRWWNGQPEPDKLKEALAESDRKLLAQIRPK